MRSGSVGTALARALQVSHVADAGCRYPGEVVTFHTRVRSGKDVAGYRLTVTLPPGLVLDDYRMTKGREQDMPLITWDDGSNHLTWTATGLSEPGACYEYQVVARIAPTAEQLLEAQEQDWLLTSRAAVQASLGDEDLRGAETATVSVARRARSLKYLPAIYHDDDLMGRFLMLFESFWDPIGRQIDGLPFYFDARTTPPGFLPWLASWIDLALDERWPEDRRRQLLYAAVPLYRRRGTRQGLEEYLEIYTGSKPKIIEHRAHNFRLGPQARLGPGIALGTVNVPHTFTVILRLPRLSSGMTEPDRSHTEQERRRRIEAIIDAEKPAHTSYVLQIEEITR